MGTPIKQVAEKGSEGRWTCVHRKIFKGSTVQQLEGATTSVAKSIVTLHHPVVQDVKTAYDEHNFEHCGDVRYQMKKLSKPEGGVLWNHF